MALDWFKFIFMTKQDTDTQGALTDFFPYFAISQTEIFLMQ